MGQPFVHLGARSAFSLGGSIAGVDALCRAAARHRQRALALTDVMSLAGAPLFDVTARSLGLAPIFGIEARLKPLAGPSTSLLWDRARVLAASEAGWRRLVQLANAGAMRGGNGVPAHVEWEELTAAPEGLIYLVGGADSALVAASGERRVEEVEQLLALLLERVPAGQLFVALPSPATRTGAHAAKILQTIADHYELPAVAVPEVRCAQPEDDFAWALTQRAEPVAADATMLDISRPHDERAHLMSTDLVMSTWRLYPHAVENAVQVADLCRVELPAPKRRFPLHEYQRGVDAESYIWNEVFSRAAERYGDLPSRWRERLNREFHELVDAGLPDAFVCLARLDAELNERHILRGPGAGFLTSSLVASLLGVTRLDPLDFDLPFSLPEGARSRACLLEMCVPAARLDEAGEALEQLFRGHLCPVAKWKHWTTTQALDAVLQHLDGVSATSAAIQKSTEWQEEWPADRPEGKDPPYDWTLGEARTLAWLTKRLEGRPRVLRSAGAEWVFSADALARTLPCAAADDGALACQWDADELARRGYGRIALRREPMLDLVDEATAWVREQGRRDFDPFVHAAGDEAAFHLLCEGRTLGVGLFEAPSVKMRLRQLQPSDLHSLVRGLKPGTESTRAQGQWFERVLLAVACAVAKAQEPAAFYAAALSQAAGDTPRQVALVHEAAANGLATRTLDINCSTWRWAPEGDALRPGFLVVRSLPRQAAREIESARREMTFSDLANLLRRTSPRLLKAAHVEALIRAGALDSFGAARSALLARLPQLDELLRPSFRRGADGGDPLQFFGQGTEWWLENLVEDDKEFAQTGDERVEWLVEQERAATGLFFCIEPLFFRREFLRHARAITPAQLKPRDRDQVRTLLSPIYAIEDPELQTADICLLDLGNCIVQAKGAVARAARRLAAEGDHVLVTGTMRRDQFQWVIEAEQIAGLEESARLAADARCLEIDIAAVPQKELKGVLGALKDYKGGTPVQLAAAPEEKNRLADRLAARKITWCPGLETALRRASASLRWRLAIRGGNDADAPRGRRTAPPTQWRQMEQSA